MEAVCLTTLAEELLATARRARSGRAARTVHGGHEHALGQTVLALCADRLLSEHDTPGEATLQVLRGRVHLTAGAEDWHGTVGDYIIIPPVRHALAAVDDAVVLLTVVRPRPQTRAAIPTRMSR